MVRIYQSKPVGEKERRRKFNAETFYYYHMPYNLNEPADTIVRLAFPHFY
jgi:hypothetical protein